jgi:1-acyl-sn-glycerol-3-phosphate acyltransferase
LFKVLKEKHIQVEVLVLPRVSVSGKDQRVLTAEIQAMMHDALLTLHRGIVA